MAKNIAENIKTSVDKNKMSESSSTISAVNKAVSCDEEKPSNIDKEVTLISGETTGTVIPEEDVDENIALLEIKQQQNTCKTDCNGDPEGETNLEKDVSEETETKTKENNESCSMKAKSNGEEATEYLSQEDQKLSKILQDLQEDLQILQSSNTSVTATDDAEDGNEREQMIMKEETDPENDMTDSTKEFTASMTAKRTEEKRDSSESSEKTEEKSEVGIVGPPTAVSELINEEELGGDSALSADQKDHVAEWVENWVNPEEEDNIAKGCKREMYEEKNAADERARRRKHNDVSSISPRKSQKIICNIIKKSIKCLNNKMHAMEGAIESKKKVSTAEDNKAPKTSSPSSSKVPQNQQNGAALPEETAAASTTAVDRVRTKKEPVMKDEVQDDVEMSDTKSKQLLAGTSRQKDSSPYDLAQRHAESVEVVKKRKAVEGQLSALGTRRKKICVEDEREKYISEVIGDDNKTLHELMAKSDQLQNDMKNLEILAREKEMEWNDILRTLKLKEEAYIRLNRKIDTKNYMENNGVELPVLPSGKSSLIDCNSGNTTPLSREKSFGSKDDLSEERSSDSVAPKREKTAKTTSQQRTTSPKTNGESSHKQNEASSPECRQIGEGRQGAIVDVRSIIADHRLKHPEAVPRRGRRMRNSVNIGLGAGGAMVETGHNTDSSSTESCKSNPSASDSMNYKEILMQFAKMSQQGEPVKVPQNYPDVTLHPVTPSTAGQNNASQPSGSLLHGILTKAQSRSEPRSNAFSPTLARLLTAPERERNSPVTAAAASMSQQSATAQHHLQTYQGSNMVSINDLLSSSKARTEITITPVVNTSAQSHSNDLIQVEDADEETTMIDDRKGNLACGRESKQIVKDNPPSPSAPLKCQGCMIRPAQFVCAGCGNQWYCSRACQLAAWTIHSDYCPSESDNSKVKSNV